MQVRGAKGRALRWLLAHGADVSLVAADGRSALHAAAASGHVAAVTLLVNAASAASPAVAARLLMNTDGDGRTAAEVAAAARKSAGTRTWSTVPLLTVDK